MMHSNQNCRYHPEDSCFEEMKEVYLCSTQSFQWGLQI